MITTFYLNFKENSCGTTSNKARRGSRVIQSLDKTYSSLSLNSPHTCTCTFPLSPSFRRLRGVQRIPFGFGDQFLLKYWDGELECTVERTSTTFRFNQRGQTKPISNNTQQLQFERGAVNAVPHWNATVFHNHRMIK